MMELQTTLINALILQRGMSVDAYGCYTFLLNYDNFEIVGTSSVCYGTQDGSIDISVNNENLQYQVSINGRKYQLNDQNGFMTF